MMKDIIANKKLVVVLFGLAFVVFAVVAWILINNGNPQTTKITSTSKQPATSTLPSNNDTQTKVRTNGELSDSIVKSVHTTAKPNGQPNFNILKVVRPLDNWYVVKITLQDVSVEPAFVILKDTGDNASGLGVVAGPGTAFPNIYLPDPVRRALK